jgi:hypothetical protein
MIRNYDGIGIREKLTKVNRKCGHVALTTPHLSCQDAANNEKIILLGELLIEDNSVAIPEEVAGMFDTWLNLA